MENASGAGEKERERLGGGREKETSFSTGSFRVFPVLPGSFGFRRNSRPNGKKSGSRASARSRALAGREGVSSLPRWAINSFSMIAKKKATRQKIKNKKNARQETTGVRGE
jgi:hypothetical protein